MAHHISPLFLLSPDPAYGGGEDKVAGHYPAGLQTLARNHGRQDSGIDLPTPADVVVAPKVVVMVNLGMRAVCIRPLYPPQYGGTPPGAVLSMTWAYRLVSRSSISKTPLMLANGEGIIDLGYRGPLIAAVRNISDEEFVIKAGTALFQLVSADLAPPEYEVLAADDPRTTEYFDTGVTARGVGGFGSTGVAGSEGLLQTADKQ